MDTPYSHVAPLWGFGMAISGLNRGLTHYIQRIPIELPDTARILDAGCGTGIVGCSMLERFPRATVVATDADRNMCSAAQKHAARRGYTDNQFSVGESDIHMPERITRLNGEQVFLEPASFDAITTGAVLEHTDLDASIPALGKLLKPGGWFVNVAMNDTPIVKIYDVLFDCRPVETERMKATLTHAGFSDISVVPLTVAEFPTNMTRIGIVARKENMA